MNMKLNKKIVVISLIVVICVIIPIHIGLGIFFNNKFFHKDAIQGTEGHYEPKVYITPTGECYHTFSCSYITRTYEIGVYQAKEKGYRPCSHCGGKSKGEIFIEGIEPQPEHNNYFGSFVLSFILVIAIPTTILIFCLYSEKEIDTFNLF